jgi:DNA-binding GntR family transcriptional regulator
MKQKENGHEKSEGSDLETNIMRCLREASEPLFPARIAELLGTGEKSVQRALGHLAKARKLRRAGGGKFVVSHRCR